MDYSTDRISHIKAFVNHVVEHWLERQIDHWVHREGSIRLPIAPRVNVLPRSYVLMNIGFRPSAYQAVKTN